MLGYMSGGPGDSTADKEQSAVSRWVLQTTWNECDLFGKTSLMFLGRFHNQNGPILWVPSVSFMWLCTTGLYLGLLEL